MFYNDNVMYSNFLEDDHFLHIEKFKWNVNNLLEETSVLIKVCEIVLKLKANIKK